MENRFKTKKEAKKRALKNIRNNIAKICGDFTVEEKISLARDRYGIDKDIYKEEEVAGINDIEDLVHFLKEKWLNQLRQEAKVAETDESIAKWNIVLEKYADSAFQRNGMVRPKGEKLNINNDKFLKEAIDNLMKGSLILFQRIKVNPLLWSSVIAAMFFHVPEKKILECQQSILYKYYLPAIDNDCLVLRLNELTELSDLILMWDLVIIKQDEYKEKHGYINSEKAYTSREADKIITDGFNGRLSVDEINAKLKDKNIKGLTSKQMKERRKAYRKQTRQPTGLRIEEQAKV